MNELTHINSDGNAVMVDVSHKIPTKRIAIARGLVKMSEKSFAAVKNNEVQKGDVLTTAKIAGIQGAKKTSELIPLCHNIFISNISLNFKLLYDENSIEVISEAKTDSVTGIEMEAITAVTIACLTIYDMCKAIDKSIKITDIELLEKSGGKSGIYKKMSN